MARLMAAMHDADDPLTVLVATSGDTGSAVANAFHRVPHTRVVILYPDGRVSPTQEAQLTMFNGVRANVRAYAVAGSFDDCHRLARQIFGNPDIRRRVPLTSANSVNVGRLSAAVDLLLSGGRPAGSSGRGRRERRGVLVPSGNFGNLTAGLLAKRAGLHVNRFIAATNVNDVVPEFLDTGTFTPRASVQTLANAMDVGHPSNFERITWLYGGDVAAIRRDITGVRASDDQIRRTIHDVYARTGYLLDPHSAVAYIGLRSRDASDRRPGILLATAHPAKFSEIVEPIIGRRVEKPAALAGGHRAAQAHRADSGGDRGGRGCARALGASSSWRRSRASRRREPSRPPSRGKCSRSSERSIRQPMPRRSTARAK